MMIMLVLRRVNDDQFAAKMDQSERIMAVVARAEELDVGSEDCLNPHCQQGAEFWEQGATAFRKDVRLEDCPYEPGPAQDDWLRGWMATELVEFGRFDDEKEPENMK